MNTSNGRSTFKKTLLALAVMALCAPALADDDEVKQLSQPQSQVSVGVSGLSGDAKSRSIFGQYSGLRANDFVLNLDVDINKRDDNAGTALYFTGNNLGLDDRDLFFSYESKATGRPGPLIPSWLHREIRTVNTGLQGRGQRHAHRGAPGHARKRRRPGPAAQAGRCRFVV